MKKIIPKSKKKEKAIPLQVSLARMIPRVGSLGSSELPKIDIDDGYNGSDDDSR